ncbi:cell division protein FtsQ/DivIB [Cellulosimicrobium cellulans]|uniref:cell division protein FtsQ/DivIB n=1 Tax=Cellulosimicrobium cellulans TaxID=1710 RepID=UPI00130DAC7A|nr:FtsQ-type POTRA domain-containing protein [Cellulosimicrobium cellulans]
MTPPQRPRPPQPPRPATPRPAPARRPAPRATPDAGDATAPTTAVPSAGRPASPSAGAAAAPRTDGRPAAPRATTPRTTGAPRTAETPAAPAGASARRTSGSTALAPRTGAFPVRPPVVSQGSAARFAERARARRRLAWRQILIAAGSVVVVAALAWLLLLSPAFALDTEQVRVAGAGTVVAVDQVRAVVDEEGGTPLTRLDTAALRQRLLDVPGVRDATVTRDWPHGLAVQLVSREPVAAVPESADVAQHAEGDDASGAGYALVDQDGVKVGRSDAPPEGLPVVEVPVGDARILSAALGVLEALPEDLLAAIGQVSAGTQDTVRFTLRDGATVEWGSAQDSALKVAVLQALRAAPETAGSTRYDVTAPTMPVVG